MLNEKATDSLAHCSEGLVGFFNITYHMVFLWASWKAIHAEGASTLFSWIGLQVVERERQHMSEIIHRLLPENMAEMVIYVGKYVPHGIYVVKHVPQHAHAHRCMDACNLIRVCNPLCHAVYTE